MDTFKTIKKFLAEGGKCLLVEDGKPIGVILTMEEYEKIKTSSCERSPEGRQNTKINSQNEEIKTESERLSNSEVENKPIAIHPIGEAIAKEIDFPGLSADINDISLADSSDVTLEDLGLDELPY